MSERRRRDFEFIGTKEQSKREVSSHGINWGIEQRGTAASGCRYSGNIEIESAWEEEDEDKDLVSFVPEDENQNCKMSIDRSGKAFSERQSVQNANFSEVDLPYSGLQKRPDFYDQHKKITLYMPQDLVETMERLKKGRYIASYSWLVTEAVRQYLSIQSKTSIIHRNRTV